MSFFLPDPRFRNGKNGAKFELQEFTVTFADEDGTVLQTGEALSGDAYSAKAGSTVVTLPASTLETWKTGKHTVTVVFDDGEAETTLTVKGRGLLAPKTGDGGLTPFWVLLMALGAGGIAFTAVGGRRYRRPKYVGKH